MGESSSEMKKLMELLKNQKREVPSIEIVEKISASEPIIEKISASEPIIEKISASEPIIEKISIQTKKVLVRKRIRLIRKN